MESIIARALEYTLKYWLKSFTRDQFKLQGRTVQLSNLDINGDALHASTGLPPALNVTTAKVGRLEIKLPAISYVQVEPIVVQIDRLDLVLEENSDSDAYKSSSTQTAATAMKGSSYGFADKIADGMTLEVSTVNLLIETRGGSQRQGGAAWASPLASITIRNLLLYTTNENWEVVNLKEARDFSNNKKCIYVFKKLEWESLSMDLLPHPDMFTDANLTCSNNGANGRDDDGAKRVFFGGERFLEGISGQAYITIQRTELNQPLGLEVQLHIPEALCPSLSEPGLRALLRFMTGFYVCLNRGDVDPRDKQRSSEAAGRSIVSVVVDHIFLCIKDTDFQLELLMQSLFFSRASVSDGHNTKNLSRITVSGIFLRDTFTHPPCTLVQPSMLASTEHSFHAPDFSTNFCPAIYPLGEQRWQVHEGVPLLCLYSLQIKPSPCPPSIASQTVINCQPLMVHLQEQSCLRICSFLADGIVVNPGAVLPDSSVSSLLFSLKELDLTVPLEVGKSDKSSSFAGARLHIQNLNFSDSPTLKLRLLNLEKDPACFCLWEDQPADASMKKWTAQVSSLILSLETFVALKRNLGFYGRSDGLWRCVEIHEICVEAAMVTQDGSPLVTIPPPGGVVRIGVACQEYLSNTSVEQLFFVLDLYAYFGRVSEKIATVGKSDEQKIKESLGGKLMEKVPSDTAVSLAMKEIQVKFVESSPTNIEGMPLVKFGGENLYIKVSHITLGGAIAVSSNISWETVQVDCLDGDGNLTLENGHQPSMRSVFWIDKKLGGNFVDSKTSSVPFLDINILNVIPYIAHKSESHDLNVSAKIAGVRLGGGMNYAEALLHRFGILDPDGGPGEGLSKGLKNLSGGPLSKLLRASPIIEEDHEEGWSSENGESVGFLDLGQPDDLDVSIELIDWLFALEGAQEMAERWWFHDEDVRREERCWHTMFQSLLVKAKSSPKHLPNGTNNSLSSKMRKAPIDVVTVGVEGLQALKPQGRNNGLQSRIKNSAGVNLEVSIVLIEDTESFKDHENVEMHDWVVENLKFSVKEPIEAVATKEELQNLAVLCRSEIDSMGRIAAGILRVLKLDTSIGQAAIDQLSNLGSESLDKLFTPDKLSRHTSTDDNVRPSSPLSLINGSPRQRLEPHQNIESTIASLESEILGSHARCSNLITELSNPSISLREQHLTDIKQLSQKLDNMQTLMAQLRSQI